MGPAAATCATATSRGKAERRLARDLPWFESCKAPPTLLEPRSINRGYRNRGAQHDAEGSRQGPGDAPASARSQRHRSWRGGAVADAAALCAGAIETVQDRLGAAPDRRRCPWRQDG